MAKTGPGSSGYVVPALSHLTKGSALIDGEHCAIDEHGRSNFTLLKNSLDGRTPVAFYAFHLLEQDGEDIARLPQIERKQRLAALLADLPDDSPIVTASMSWAMARPCSTR